MTTTTVTVPVMVPPLDLPRPQFVRAVRPGHGLVPAVPAPPDPSVRCAVVVLDRDGRLASAQAVRPLGWGAEHSVHVTVRDDLIALTSTRDDVHGSVVRLDTRGDLRLPAQVRRQVWLNRGDRVLVVSDTRDDLLLVIPPRGIERLLAPVVSQPSDEVAGGGCRG